MILQRVLLAALLLAAPPSLAQTAVPTEVEQSVERLGTVMQLDGLFAVLREEGLQSGRDLAKGLFPDGGGPGWEAELARIYDETALRTRFDAVLADEMAADPAALDAVLDFFGSPLGQRILGLEIAARRAFLDKAAEEAAQVAADDAAAAKDPKVALIRRMIEAGDLLEMNVAGALTGNLAFAQGMVDAGGPDAQVPADQLSADSWAREDQTRADLQTWLYAYLGLAYAPLTEAELQSYVAFWESPAGKSLNGALFKAFDAAFRPVSKELGRAAGLELQGRDI